MPETEQKGIAVSESEPLNGFTGFSSRSKTQFQYSRSQDDMKERVALEFDRDNLTRCRRLTGGGRGLR